MLTADDYHPPSWLRNPHLQSVLSSSALRRRRGVRALDATGAVTTEHIFDGGDGVRLQGLHSAVPGKTSRGLALLLHGWEGSTESSYMRLTAARLLEARFRSVPPQLPRPRRHPSSQRRAVPLQPHGRSGPRGRAMSPGASRTAGVVAAGYSLGGNFALRLALRAPAGGLAAGAGRRRSARCWIRRVTMERWKKACRCTTGTSSASGAHSLERKRELFPERHNYDDETLA